MAETYGPYNAGAGANFDETYWREYFANLFATGVIKGAKVNGVAGGDLAVSAPGGVMSVNIASGIAHVYGFFYRNDASLAKTIAAADPSLPRIDRIIIRMDFVGRTVQSAVLQGTPNASPVAPTLTQTSTTYELSLAQVRVNAAVTQIVAANVTDERTYEGPTIGTGSIPTADLASGALPSGVTLPASQLSSGALGAGVTIPGSQVTGAVGSATNATNATNLTGGTINADSGAISSSGTGILTAAIHSPTAGNSNVFYGWAPISGTGTVTVSHTLGTTPNEALAMAHVSGSQTQGYDSETSTTVHVTSGAGQAWTGFVFQRG